MDLMEKLTYQANGIIRNNFSEYQRKQLGHSLEEILSYCKFNGENCSANDFDWTYDSYIGNCFVFNSNKSRNSNMVGFLFGLRLILFSNYHENLTLLNSYIGGSGLVIRVENNSYLSNNEMNGVQIQSGTYTNVEITRSFKYILPKPFSNCEIDMTNPLGFNSIFYNIIKNSSYLYTQDLCLTQCLQYRVIEKCLCSDNFKLSLFTRAKSCQTRQEINCMNKNGREYTQFCYDSCPLECHHLEYKTTLTSVNLIGDYYLDMIKENENLSRNFHKKSVDTNLARESFVRLNIYYDSLSYTHSSETRKMDIFNLVSYVGGILGLFLGINAFSLCELVEMFIEMFVFRKKLFNLYRK